MRKHAFCCIYEWLIVINYFFINNLTRARSLEKSENGREQNIQMFCSYLRSGTTT